jgi:hypothetical protein
VLAVFLATLVSVNWVERQAEKEKAIEAGGTDLWQNLSLVIKEVCDSFNSHYGHQYSAVTVKPEGKSRLRITRNLMRSISHSHSRPESISLQIAYEPEHFQITAACPTVNVVAKVELEFNQEQSTTPFLASDSERISDDQASKILLNEFLFSRKFIGS